MLLSRDYFKNTNTVMLAEDLLGKYLVRDLGNGQLMKSMIIETEAYHGETDQACHARFGKTDRNQVMYQEGGVWYVYLCYGIHWLLNIVTGERDFPSAILIRGITDASGPGRVTKRLGIDKSFYGLTASPESGLWVEDHGYCSNGKIDITPRIGIDYAGECAKKPWRFVLKDDLIKIKNGKN